MRGVPDFVAAGIEAMQEAGVVGYVSRKPIGTYYYSKTRPIPSESTKVEVYRLDVIGILPYWPEKRRRKVMWASLTLASDIVTDPSLQKMLREVGAMLLAPATES